MSCALTPAPLPLPPARPLYPPLQISKSGGSSIKPDLLRQILPTPTSSSTPSSSSSSSSPSLASRLASLGASASGSSRGSSSSGSPPSSLVGSGRIMRVRFTLQQELPFGQTLKLVGSHPLLGSWDESKAPMMVWTEGHKWQADVALPCGTAVEFKAVKVLGPDGATEWENGPNHVLLLPAASAGASTMAVKVQWGAGTSIVEEVAGSANSAPGGGIRSTAAASKPSSGSNGSSSNGSNGSGSSAAMKPKVRRAGVAWRLFDWLCLQA